MSLHDDAQRAIRESQAEERRERHDTLTVKQYADRFGVHAQTVYSAIRYQRMPKVHVVVRIGSAIRIVVPRESINGLTAS